MCSTNAADLAALESLEPMIRELLTEQLLKFSSSRRVHHRSSMKNKKYDGLSAWPLIVPFAKIKYHNKSHSKL